MRAFTALVWREISERRALLAAAAVASLLPILAPLLPSTGSNPAADVRVAVMWIMVGFLVPLFALLLGVSFIGRDLSEGRLGFDFAQPLSGPTIWFGKLTAVAVLVWGAQLLIMLPTVLLSPDSVHILIQAGQEMVPRWHSFLWQFFALPLWLVPLAVVLFSHAVGVVWRSRSVWLALDLIAVLVVTGGAWLAIRPFLPPVAPDAALAGSLWVVAWVFLGLIIAGAAQLTFGRVDLRRAHRFLSTTLWGILAVAVGALVGWSNWVRSATPQDLQGVGTVSVASGEWIAVSGWTRGRLDYGPKFILNAEDGRWFRIDSAASWYGQNLWFSGDGQRAFWGRWSPSDERSLMYVDLDDKDLVVRDSGLVLHQNHSDIGVTSEGDRIAVLAGRTVAVYGVETGDQLAAVFIKGEFKPNQCWFEAPDTVVIFASTPWIWNGTHGEWRSTKFRFDVASKKLTRGEAVKETYATRGSPETLVAQNRRRLERVESEKGDTLALVDLESGEVVADLGEIQGANHDWWDVLDLGDGRFFVLRRLGNESFLDTFDDDGVPQHRVAFGRNKVARLGGVVAPGRLMLGVKNWRTDTSEFEGSRTSLLNIETGLVETTIDGFYPLQAMGWRGPSAVGSGAWQPGSVSSRLLQAEDGSLHLLDPATGTIKPLIPAIG